MKLHLLSISVHGINNDHKVGVIRDYIGSLTPRIDVLCSQEQKLRGNNVDKDIRMLSKEKKKSLCSIETCPSNEVEVRKHVQGAVVLPYVFILDYSR